MLPERCAHPSCPRAKLPATRAEFRRQKLEANTERDARALVALEEAGWTALVVWECEIGPDALDALYRRIVAESAGARSRG